MFSIIKIRLLIEKSFQKWLIKYLERSRKVIEIIKKINLPHQYKSDYQKTISSAITHTDYWEDVRINLSKNSIVLNI